MSQEDEAQSAAAAKAAKREKKRLKKLAAQQSGSAAEASTSTSVAASPSGNDNGDAEDAEAERKRLKKEKKLKKRKLEESTEGQEAEESTVSDAKKDKKQKKSKKNESDEAAATSTNGAEPSPTENGEEKPEKKKRKKNVKGAFGNAQKEQAASTSNGHASTSSSSSTNNASAPSPKEVAAFIKESELTYEPEGSATNFPPFLSFDALPVADGIKAGLSGFAKPTIVQSASWGIQLGAANKDRPRDCVAIAATGSGKTLAFGVPILHHILNLPTSLKGTVNALVVAPTRELAMQTQTNLGHISETLGLGIVCLYGGASKPEQVRLLQKKPRIVVGTPGRLLDLASEGSLDLSNVQWLVLDEADRMLDKGFENDIRNIIGQCKPSAAGAEGRITSMFSATWPVSVRRLANDFMVDPIRIIVGSDELSANTSVKQSVIVLQDGRQKDGKLLDVMRAEGYPSPRYGKQPKSGTGAQREKVLVFALYKKEAARVATWLERQGYEVGCIQGDLSQDKRTKALEDFRQGITGVLVATDVAARGLDIPKVELVVNYTFPLLVEDYVHRIGRTGRAGREGRSVTFFTDAEKHLAGELQRVLRDAGQEVPDDLAAFGGTIKKKAHAAYGDHYREIDPNIKAKKITFD